MSAKSELKLRIILEQPPKGFDFGLQKGRGTIYETVQKKRFSGKDLIFEFTVDVIVDGDLKSGGKASPGFAGPFVQGPTRGQFVYIDIGTYAGQADSAWGGRLKVPLIGITTAMIHSGKFLETRVPGTARDGSPTVATVKPFDGWKLAQG